MQYLLLKMKKVLVDLSVLKHLNCGLGQVAYNYGRYFGQHAKQYEFEVHLLVPKSFVGSFGMDVHYHISHERYALFPCLLPKFDVWHSIHQLSRFKPSRRSTHNILTIHDLNFLYEKTAFSQKKYLRRIKRKINRACRVLCISEFAKKDVERVFKVEKDIEVLYNGIEFASVSDEKQPELPSDKKFIFTIGQIMPKKNFHVLLDAMKLLPEYALYIAGKNSSEYADMIRRRIEDEHIGNVFLLGEILHSEKVWFYHHCEAFVFPSIFEGFGLPIVEAMYFKKPVVSSDKTSLREIGADHVRFLRNFKAKHIASMIKQAIEDFAKDPEVALRNEAYAKSFSYDRHLGRYVEIYRELLEE